MAQCNARTNEGTLCQIPAKEGQKYCHVHRRQFLWRAIFSRVGIGALGLGLLGFIANLTGVLGYFGITPTISKNKANEELLASPYQNAYLYLVSTTPPKETIFTGGDDIEYTYVVNYYIPDFDWFSLGFEPIIHTGICNEPDDYGNKSWIIANSTRAENSKKGEEKSIILRGKFIVPNTDDECQINVSLQFRNIATGVSTNHKPHQIILPYKVLKTNYKRAYLQLVSADGYNTNPLEPGSEVKLVFKVKYFVSEFEVQKNKFSPLISIGQVISTDEYGSTTSRNMLDQPAEIGIETTKEFTVYAKVPDSAKVTIRIQLVTDPKVTPSYQMYEYNLPFPE